MDKKSKYTGLVMGSYGKVGDLDHSFDIEFWQRQSAEARFAAAWELVETTYQWKGWSLDELTLDRSAEAVRKTSG